MATNDAFIDPKHSINSNIVKYVDMLIYMKKVSFIYVIAKLNFQQQLL